MLYVYAKNDQADMDAAGRKAACASVGAWRTGIAKEVDRRVRRGADPMNRRV